MRFGPQDKAAGGRQFTAEVAPFPPTLVVDPAHLSALSVMTTNEDVQAVGSSGGDRGCRGETAAEPVAPLRSVPAFVSEPAFEASNKHERPVDEENSARASAFLDAGGVETVIALGLNLEITSERESGTLAIRTAGALLARRS